VLQVDITVQKLLQRFDPRLRHASNHVNLAVPMLYCTARRRTRKLSARVGALAAETRKLYTRAECCRVDQLASWGTSRGSRTCLLTVQITVSDMHQVCST
jgi:hypothetical protein